MPWNPSQWDEYIDGAGTFVPPVDLSIPPIEMQAPAPLAVPELGQPVPTDAQQFAAPPMPAPKLSPEEEAQIEIDQPAGAVAAANTVEKPIEVDAVSGVGKVPQAGEYAGPGQTSGKPELPPEYMTDEEYGGYLSTLPLEQQEIERAKIEGAKQRFASARVLEASDKALRQAEDNARTYQESVKAAQQHSAELDAEAKKLADENPLDSISGTRKVFGVLASIVGGFMVNKTGRNMGLEAVDQMANEAAALHAQKLALNARQQAGVGDQVARANDVYRAGEAVRLATYDGAIKTLETQVQDFDPRGTTALRVMDNINALKAKRAELLQKYTIEQQKRIEEALKLQRENAQLLETNRHNVAGEKADATRAYADLLRAKTEKTKADAEAGPTYAPAELQQLYGTTPDLVPPIPMNAKQYEKWLATKKAGGDVTKITQETSPEERNRQLGVGEIVDDKGDSVKFRTPDFAGKLADTKGDVDAAVGLIDELVRLRNQKGWSSDIVKSEGWTKVKGAMSSLLMKAKNTDQLGVLSGSDVELEMQKLTGGLDPTGIRDPVPALLAARGRMLDDFNAKVRAQAVLPKGRTLPGYAPPNMYSVEAATPLIQGKTGIEQGEGAKLGTVGQRLSFTTNDERARKAEANADVGSTGLDTKDDERVRAAIKLAQSDEPGDSVQRLVDAASTTRPSVNHGVMNLIRAEAPDLFAKVLAKMPAKHQAEFKTDSVDFGFAGSMQFNMSDVKDLAASARKDPEVLNVITDKAVNGTIGEKAKAVEVLKLMQGGR